MNNSIEEVQRAVRDLSGFTIKDQCSHVKNQEMSRWLAAGYLVCKDLGYTIGEISRAWNRAYTGPHKTMERLANHPLVCQRVLLIKQELHGGGPSLTLKDALEAVRAAERAIMALMEK